MNMKKCIAVICILATGFIVACSSTSRVPAPQPGDFANMWGRSASGRNGVVSSAKPEASQVGLDILRSGGNAVDAAVATGFALSVIEPYASGLGGGGFMIIKLVDMDDPVVIDFREMAPGAATPDMFLGPDGNVVPNSHVIGGLASGTPGEAAGLLYALENYGSGKLTRQQIMQPAIDFAENGYTITEYMAGAILDEIGLINRFPATAAIYTDDEFPLEAGTILRNPDLANTMRLIAEQGPDAFYHGPLAEKIAQAVQDAGGIITVDDLANYQVKIREPIRGTYRGYEILTVPPPSSGGASLIQILNMLENIDPSDLAFAEPAAAHAWVQAMRLSFADRITFMGDSDFVNVPIAGLIDKGYARERFALFNPAIPMLDATNGQPNRNVAGSTTSFSVMDRAGNTVTVTKTINYYFGSGVVVPGTGIIMNNQMDDFVPTPGHIQSVEPFKRPMSSMTPTIVLDPQGRPFMTLGSPGSARIFQALAQVISNVIDNGMTIQEAINAPRLFSTHTGPVNVEARLPAHTVEGLQNMGYTVDDLGWACTVQAVLFDQREGRLYGGADPRQDSVAKAF